MGRVAYSIAGAAETAGVEEKIITAAVKAGELTARRIDGDKAIILHTDIQAWAETLPTF